MDKEKVTQFLDKLDIEYDLLQHPAAVTDDAIKYLDENHQKEIADRIYEEKVSTYADRVINNRTGDVYTCPESIKFIGEIKIK